MIEGVIILAMSQIFHQFQCINRKVLKIVSARLNFWMSLQILIFYLVVLWTINSQDLWQTVPKKVHVSRVYEIIEMMTIKN